jgi:uncharacterized cupin superfamily protein
VVLDGRIVIQTGQGGTLMLGRGDIAFLAGGTTCVLTGPERWRSAFHLTSSMPAS